MPNRDVLTVNLRPLTGDRFQPTGFPDIGAATYDRPVGRDGWESCLLVESAQSMANHLEATAWGPELRPVDAFAGLPYVRVVNAEGEYVTSSRTEAHRLASAFVKDALLGDRKMTEVIKERLDLRDDTPLAPRGIALAVMKLDPMCLVHGVFFADKPNVWPGQPKVARALTSFVEAHDVRRAISGGVKRDEVRHTTVGTGGAAEGYGFVPFHRTEWVARDIVASFTLDLDQIASYGLPDPGGALLATAARWEVRSLLDHGFRPRTGCDLETDGDIDGMLPPLETLTSELRRLIAESAELLGGGQPLDVVWTPAGAKGRKT